MDETYWRKFLTENKRARPQIEYIDYDVDRLGSEGTFEEHVGNYAAVTAIVLLSDPDADFLGGLNYFWINGSRPCGGDFDATARRLSVPLHKGDAVFFRGEVVVHGIVPVVKGRRVVLQTDMTALRPFQGNGEVPGEDCFM